MSARPARVLGLLLLLALGGCRAPEVERQAPPLGEAVVLVHGMGRTPLSMAALERDFERAGYRVLNWGYSSYCCTVAELADRLAVDVAAWRGDADTVHFVGHSLGNIIVRQLLARDAGFPVGRVVMLAPPNQGSRSADRHARWLGAVLKPLPELRTDSTSTVRRLPPPPDVPIGIIAAARDGKVSVAETRLEGATAHIVVPGAHSFMMLQQDVRTLALAFVRDGRF